MKTNTDLNISLFDYVDYRSFLTDFYKSKQKVNENFSLGVWSKQLGLASTASLSRVLTGVRSPGKEWNEKMTKYFKFNEKQSEYFNHLILLDKGKSDPQMTVLIMEKLRSLHPLKKFALLDHETFSTIANWYYFTIREMVHLEGFQNDPEWIVEKLNFRVTEREVKTAIKYMVKLGLLVEENGNLSQGPDHIDWNNDQASEASKINHEQNLDLAKKALREIDRDLREFQSVCMTIPTDRISLAKKTIREFKTRMIHLLEVRNSGDATYQLQIQFFPYTKTIKKKDEVLQ